MADKADKTGFPEIAELKNVPVDDVTAQQLSAWMYPAAGESGPPKLVLEHLRHDHVRGTVSLVLRSKNPPTQD